MTTLTLGLSATGERGPAGARVKGWLLCPFEGRRGLGHSTPLRAGCGAETPAGSCPNHGKLLNLSVPQSPGLWNGGGG